MGSDAPAMKKGGFAFNAFAAGSKLAQKTPEVKLGQGPSAPFTHHTHQAHQAHHAHHTPAGLVAGAGASSQRPMGSENESYQMTPYRSDSDESDDEGRPAKPVPQWARSKNLNRQLRAQLSADPDEIFKAHETTCSLDEVFSTTGKSKPCYKRRGSSGNWLEDRVTWKEEWFYKKAMGYV